MRKRQTTASKAEEQNSAPADAPKVTTSAGVTLKPTPYVFETETTLPGEYTIRYRFEFPTRVEMESFVARHVFGRGY